MQSGKIANFSEISQELGPTVVTIQSYYQILEDTLFFDMGVRRVLSDESRKLSPDRKGDMFEHWIGNEIIKWINLGHKGAKLFFWRDPDGPEVDWLIEYEGSLLPIKVKLNLQPKNNSIKHLKTFMREYHHAESALVVCTTEFSYQLENIIDIISYKELHSYLDQWIKNVSLD